MDSRSSFLPSEGSLDLFELDEAGTGLASMSVSTQVPLQTSQGQEENSPILPQQETKDSRKVLILRRIFVIILVAAGVFTAVFVYLSTAEREETLFEGSFDSLAVRMTANIFLAFQTKFLTANSIAASLTSDALFYNKTWPNILLPDFDLRFQGNRIIANAETILFSPVVTDLDRVSWEAFVLENADHFTTGLPTDDSSCPTSGSLNECRTLADGIFMPGPDGTRIPDPGPGPYIPGFLISTNNASENANQILINYYGLEKFKKIYDSLLDQQIPVLSSSSQSNDAQTSFIFSPVFDFLSAPWSVVGVVSLSVHWLSEFQSLSPLGGSVIAVLVIGGGEVMSFEIFEEYARFLGNGDHHDPRFENYVVTSQVTYAEIFNSTIEGDAYNLSIYPTAAFEAVYKTSLPVIYAVVVSSIFFLIIILFIVYNYLVERGFDQRIEEAVRFHDVVNSLLPPVVRNRIFDPESTTVIIPKKRPAPMRRWDSFARRSNNDDLRLAEPAKARLRTFLNRSESQNRTDMEQYQLEDPIADLFPDTTVMFADISGFTAWSSEREPSQVFYLLETLYRAFDQLASRLGVFKVETIGDCYVAVTGLPDPNQDHALVMARFAYECLIEMNNLVKSLEVSLGPGTSDLAIRVGLHSGPVTAGVLRGEKARFQLFGDTMNTASRMESTGTRNRIHVSEDTAILLRRGGKGHWLTERDGLVHAKGKGEIKTWWLKPQRATCSKASRMDNTPIEENKRPPESKPPGSLIFPRRPSKAADTWGNLTLGIYGVDEDKKARLVNWNVEIFSELLSKVVVWRLMRAHAFNRQRRLDSSGHTVEYEDDVPSCAFDEVSEVISFPTFSENATRLGSVVPDASRISDKVKGQLHHFISRIADCYHNVPFHNLEHASHVTLSANKLMKRIIAPGETEFTQPDEDRRRMRRRRSSGDVMNNFDTIERTSHTSTFGISSDPLCQFAIVFSALIHDVDHCGVTNAQLVKENAPIAFKYHNRSVAEQNSVDISWNILMDDRYQDLRSCIFENDTERRRFRQLVVNSVMATDIVDKELKQLRDNRWATAFDESKFSSMSDVDVHRKATIVIEHIIQASDVAHTMQHWHIYSKWNEKLFCEMYTAYLSGRAANDPSEGWYRGEIWFFDNYIIPLAKKLKECGVFGVASDEYLGFALENREEWVIKGKSVVANILKNYKERHGEQSSATASTGDACDGKVIVETTQAVTEVVDTIQLDEQQLPTSDTQV